MRLFRHLLLLLGLLMASTGVQAQTDLETPLTLEAFEAGTIVVSNPQSGMQYSLNGGDKTAVTSTAIQVNAGDKVQFFGNNSIVYNNKNTDISDDTRFTGDADCFIYGNIMSLVDEENYSTATALTADSVFCGLFRDNTHLYNHDTKELLLPATTLSAGCYRALFRGCTNLAHAPALPAMTLTDYCYYTMFYGCTGLTTAPALPATTLAERCYASMFSGCAGLTTVPADLLPATTLTTRCYNGMFSNCTNLTTVPALPATTMAERCYASMFSGCTGLTSVPADLLPATTLATSCYSNMFTGCTGLTTVPADLLPATTLADNCYQSLFMNCTNLTTVPAGLLPATTLTNVCYRSMFMNCTNLTTVPADLLPVTTLAPECYFDLFCGCTSLTSAPDLPATTLAESCYQNMFSGCSSLNSVTCLATDISATKATTNWLNGVAATGTFIKAEGMTSWPRTGSGIPSGWAAYDNIPLTLEAKTAGTIEVSNPKSGMKYSKNGGEKTAVTSDAISVAVGDRVQFFGNGTSITSYDGTQIGGTAQCYIYGVIMSLVDEENFATATTLTAANAFRNLFSGNTNLFNHSTNELGLSATTLTEGCYNGMFSGCTNLTSAPALRATTLTNACYQGMFSGCTGLTSAPALPATTLANACYQSMFSGCTNLTSAPDLPATTLVENCYKEMFNGCTSLNAVTCYATDISATDATTNWLKDVAATGTFSKNEATAWVTNSPSGIPNGWSPTDDLLASPLTLQAKTAGTIVVANPQSGMQYSLNGGAKTAVTSDPINVEIGNTVAFYGNGTNIASYFSDDSDDNNDTKITGGTAECYIYGNIMSLVDETGYASATALTGENAFRSLFNGNANLYNHDSKDLVLPATTLTTRCYQSMFYNCTNLTKVPALPAKSMISYCYYYMFYGCIGLTSLPADLLPSTTLADYCYGCMFRGCTGLKTLPAGLLPATTLVNRCYYAMFHSCTELTSVPADLLPATTMAIFSYQNMFYGCTKLETAPELPAKTLVNGCYYQMFYNCSSLNSVTCLATTITVPNATLPTSNWLYGVAATGTFTKASTANWGTTRSVNKIPSGWTVVNKATLTDGNDVSALTPCAGEVCIVEYKRAFTESKPSTVCLPFDYAKKEGEKFYSFTGVEKDGEGNFVATMTEYTGANLVANSPYLYLSATTGETDFSGTYTLPEDLTAGTKENGDWKFVGSFVEQKWTEAPTGIYGFSAKDANDGICQGEFVKVGAKVKMKPMRAYLEYKSGSENYSAVRSKPSYRAAANNGPLPETIKVRFVDANGEVTGIGTLEIKTGEVSIDSEAWYTLEGVRLAGKPTQKGIYVNNGKKVMIK